MIAKLKLEAKGTFEKQKYIVEDYMECEYCPEEFSSKKLFEEHIHPCPLCEMEFKEPPYYQSNHIIHHHEEFYCKNCCKYFT